MVNYPNEHPYTRVTEFKYLTGQEHPKTSVVYEYPMADGDPYYPVPRPENAEIYKKYKALADQTPGVHFVGRLATYKYYNMDQVVAQALTLVCHGSPGCRAPRRQRPTRRCRLRSCCRKSSPQHAMAAARHRSTTFSQSWPALTRSGGSCEHAAQDSTLYFVLSHIRTLICQSILKYNYA